MSQRTADHAHNAGGVYDLDLRAEHVRRLAVPFPAGIHERISHDAMQPRPGVRTGRIAMQAHVGAGQRLLDEVLGVAEVASQLESRWIQLAPAALNFPLEQEMIRR